MSFPSPLRLGAVALALAVPAAPAAADDPKIDHERYLLDNGLEVILHQDNSVPLVAVDVWYHVGAGAEVPGRSGFAHLFEHMLFQSSVHVGEDKFFERLRSVGASGVNGTTSEDRTNYFEMVPSHQLEAALWMESDRMGYFLPMLTQASLDNQKEVVRNERRQRIDNVPYGKTGERRHLLLYPEGHPYRYMVIGKHSELAAATLDDVRTFYKTWYVPANATLVIAGDFDVAECKALVKKWFGPFPRSTKPVHRKVPMPKLARVKETLTDPFAKLRQVSWTWHSPAAYAEGDAELSILGRALTSNTGRLYKRLVVETQLATAVFGGQNTAQHSSIFSIAATLRSDADLAKVEKIIDEEIALVMSKPIDRKEFDRVVAERESGFVWGLQNLLARAETLQRYNHYVGTPDWITQDLDRVRKSSPERVRDVAARYLGRDKRVELVTVPEGK